MNIEPIKKVTVTEQIMERIAQMITNGELRPGEKLPNERLLADKFGVARGRIREALRALSLVGLITIKAGEGSYVNHREQPIPQETITWLFHHELHNLDELYDARKLIESAVYLSAAKYASDSQLAQLDDMIRMLEATKTKKHVQVNEYVQMLDQFDLYAGEICGNRIYNKLMQTIVLLRRESISRLLTVPGCIESSIETRSRLLHALKTRDLDTVQSAIDYFFTKAKWFYNNIIDA